MIGFTAYCWSPSRSASSSTRRSSTTFTRNLRTSRGGQLQSVLAQLEHIASGLGGIKAVLKKE